MASFIKNNIYVIAGAVCVVAICVLYFTQNGGRESSLSIDGTETTVIYDSGETEASAAEPPAEETSLPPAASEPPAVLSAGDAPETIQVYITGEVIAPGVYEVPPDARVWQVLEKAGGFTERAAEDFVNLAAYVTDAQQIAVPSAGDPSLAEIDPGDAPYGVASDGTVIPEAAPSGAQGIAPEITAGSPEAGGPVNINTADSALLQTLPGIGERIASYIVAYREQNGGFKTIDEMRNVPRIGAVTFDKIKDKITVGGM